VTLEGFSDSPGGETNGSAEQQNEQRRMNRLRSQEDAIMKVRSPLGGHDNICSDTEVGCAS